MILKKLSDYHFRFRRDEEEDLFVITLYRDGEDNQGRQRTEIAKEWELPK